MDALVDLFVRTPLLVLFGVIGVGFLLGSVRVSGFSLGPAAVLFAGILFGAFDRRLLIPDVVYVFGLVLFVYCIGIASGATFFSAFGKRGVRANIVAAFALVAAAMVAAAFALAGGIPGATAVGVFCGALTNTPALAATLEALAGRGTDITSQPVIGYSVVYPFGVIGVLLAFHLFERRAKRKAEREGPASSVAARKPADPIVVKTFRVTGSRAAGRTAGELLATVEGAGLVLSRIKRGEDTSLVYDETRFREGDLVVAVGTAASLERARTLLGEASPVELPLDKQDLDYRRIEVSSRAVVGRSIAELELPERFDATVTRVRRGDVDFVPSPDTVVELGDRVRVLTWVGNIGRVTRFFGDSVRSTSEADFFSLSLGIVLGVLLGMLPIPLPGGRSFTLGFAGGPLLVGLVLGRLQRTGPVVWGMPYSANIALRQVGLVLFLAGIGTKAGGGFIETLQATGISLVVAGAAVTTVTTLIVLVAGERYLKLPLVGVMGMMAGVQTQPACLAYVDERSSGSEHTLWYSTVYPLAMIMKILLAQALVALLL
jgi:putative transport protein